MPLWNAFRECQNENHFASAYVKNHFARPYVSNILQMPTWKMSYKCAHVNIILQTPMWYEVIFASCNLEIILKMLMWKLFCNKRINKQALHKFQIQRTTGTKSLNSFKRSLRGRNPEIWNRLYDTIYSKMKFQILEKIYKETTKKCN